VRLSGEALNDLAVGAVSCTEAEQDPTT
jgi:hypothetical protein